MTRMADGVSVDDMRRALGKFLEGSHTQQRLYHGTAATEGGKGKEAIRNLKASKEGALGSGVYLTPEPDFAGEYAKKPGGNVLPVHARITNPLVIRSKRGQDPMIMALVQLGMTPDKAANMVEKAYEQKGYIGKQVQQRAQAAGHDALMQYRDGDLTEVVHYNPRMIKSATGNRGTYDTSKDDLSMATGGSVKAKAYSPLDKLVGQTYAKGGPVEVRPTVKDDAIQRKVPEMEEAAKALQAGAITRKDYDKVVQQHKPVKPYTFVPKPASDKDADRALMENKKPQWRGHEQWPAGRKVGLRLDIPAYEHHGVWVNSVHDEEGSGKDKYPTAYHSVSSVKNATFDASPEKAVRVATGEQNKSPFARIKGELHHMSEDEAVEHMKAHLNHPDWAQVGMDPRRHGFFYDRKTLKPVTHSAHVVQIGPLVLAHKPTYGKRETYAKGGAVSRETIKGKVTMSPNMDVMRYELHNRKAK